MGRKNLHFFYTNMFLFAQAHSSKGIESIVTRLKNVNLM